ncbi:amidohydrolase family protein [Cytobacillus firmus]|uniref:amidohydrolase family protein n=1 Tax=Cytobacillus firmus TaxID=1399 RepID=UPI001CFD0AA6|nr:amidohydrolase family protein [Cytobacillus firmus]WHY59677.1 amidohydrolase family protein [Cytobacillus firmus]
MSEQLNKHQQPLSGKNAFGLIDCDVHPVLTSLEELSPYLDEATQKQLNIGKFSNGKFKNQNNAGFEFPTGRYGNPGHVLRMDAVPPCGGSPGSNPDFLLKDLFDRYHHRYGILNIGHGTMASYHNVNLAVEYTRAANDWLYEKWVERDPRFKMTMEITPLDPHESIKEIERIGRKPGIVGINLRVVNIPFGKRHFWPIYEAAEENGLPLLIHPDSEGTSEYAPSQAIGPASTYIEWHSTLPIIAMREIPSLVFEGVFERFPNLKFAFIEYGFAWLAHIMWRLDKNWKGLRQEVPWLKTLPSEYIRRHIRIGTQPIEEPFKPNHLLELIQMLKAEDMLLFCSDYPHWDGDNLQRIFLRFPEELKNKIYYENALNTFRF